MGPMPNSPEVFIQYKNTDICLDFWCTCGQEGHYDGYFASNVECPSCGAVFGLPSMLSLQPQNHDAPTVKVVADEDAISS